MEKHSEYALLGLKALERAAIKVFEDAKKNNHKIPVWKNGQIIYEIPEIEVGQLSSVDSKSGVPD
ncbi:MAG: hypothetical protein ACUZ8O_11095 [Candidatus Anammoxibacter sp.]